MNSINHKIYLYWNGTLSREGLCSQLSSYPAKTLADWIDDTINRSEEAMNLATSEIKHEVRQCISCRKIKNISEFYRIDHEAPICNDCVENCNKNKQ